MIDALGTSTPTSITVVDTMMALAPDLNRSIASFFSSALMRPCRSPTPHSGNSAFSVSHVSTADFRSSFSDSSTSGSTKYACLPSAMYLRTALYTPRSRDSGNDIVFTGIRDAGFSRMYETSMSP